MVAASQVALGPVHFRCAQHIHKPQATSTQVRSNDVWLRCFPAPSFGSPLHHVFISHTFFYLFLFMSFLPSCLFVSSFFSFAHTLVRPLAYSCAITPNEVLGRPGCYKEVWFIVCPWSLGSSSQPRTLGLSCPLFTPSSFRLNCVRVAHSSSRTWSFSLMTWSFRLLTWSFQR